MDKVFVLLGVRTSDFETDVFRGLFSTAEKAVEFIQKERREVAANPDRNPNTNWSELEPVRVSKTEWLLIPAYFQEQARKDQNFHWFAHYAVRETAID